MEGLLSGGDSLQSIGFKAISLGAPATKHCTQTNFQSPKRAMLFLVARPEHAAKRLSEAATLLGAWILTTKSVSKLEACLVTCLRRVSKENEHMRAAV